MKHARQSCGVAFMNGFIYVAGGCIGQAMLNVFEKYIIDINQWEDLPPMSTRRGGLKLLEHNGKLYVIGGSDGTINLNSIECYDPAKNQWELNARSTQLF